MDIEGDKPNLDHGLSVTSSPVEHVVIRIPESSLTGKYLEIGLVVVTFWLISIPMVFLSKYLLSDQSINLEAPLFITLCQSAVTLVLTVVITPLSRFSSKYKNKLPAIEHNLDILKSILPLSLMFVGMLTFNNLCLKFVGVSFYFVSRSLTNVFSVVFSYLVLGQKTSLAAIICCLTIVLGFFLGVNQENRTGLSFIGVIYGLLASFCIALFSVLVKKVLPKLNNSVWLLMYYNNLIASFVLLILVLVTNERTLVANYKHLTEPMLVSLMTLHGLFGFAISYLTALHIKVTSPLTLNISGTAKASVQTVMAVVFFGEVKSFLWWTSNFLVVFSSAAYARIRQLEMQSAHEDGQEPKTKTKSEQEINSLAVSEECPN